MPWMLLLSKSWKFMLTHWRVIFSALMVIAVLASLAYVKHVIGERDDLVRINAHLQEQVELAGEMQRFTGEVAKAIDKVKERSAVNVNYIQTAPKPVFTDDKPMVFIAAGLLPSVLQADIADGAAPTDEASGAVETLEQAVRILPDGSGEKGHTDQP